MKEKKNIRKMITHEFARTNGYIKANNIKDLKKILKLKHQMIYGCLKILANEIIKLEILLNKTNKLLEEVKDNL